MSAVLEEIIEKITLLSEKEQERLIAAVEEQRRNKAELDRRALIDSVMGKYAFVPTSSDDFARRKQEEIRLEDRRSKDS